MKFDRFRAYAESEGTRSEHQESEDDEGRVTKERVVVDSWPVEDVAFEGKASGDGETAAFDSDKTKITRVVFYRGDADGERVVGSVEVGKAGKIDVRCPDRKPKAD